MPAGVNGAINFGRPHTTYWFASGVHTLGGAAYAQINPATGATFVGAPGAVVDGQHKNYYAFADHASDVRISYLTIENFGTDGGNNNEGVVNHDSGTGWRIDHSTIEGNAGAGVMLGSDNALTFDCLRSNQQYGFNAYSATGPKNLLLADNEIAGNDTYNWEKRVPGCGCTGGGKFWNVTGATVKENWVHDNHSVGMWADTDNRGFDFERNVFQGNYDVGLVYEISYNALIKDNVFVRNGFGEGPHNDGFPTGAIYISESGSDPRLPTSYNKTFAITGNLFSRQLERRDLVGELESVLRLAGQQQHDGLHAGGPKGGQPQDVYPAAPAAGQAGPDARLLRPVPVEDPECRGRAQHLHLQPGQHRPGLYGRERVRLRRHLLRVGQRPILEPLPGPGGGGQHHLPPGQSFRRQRLHRSLAVPGPPTRHDRDLECLARPAIPAGRGEHAAPVTAARPG